MGNPILIIIALLSRFATAIINSAISNPDSFSIPLVAIAQMLSLLLICLFGRPTRTSRKSWLAFGLWTISTLFFSGAVMKFAERGISLHNGIEVTAVEMGLPLMVIAVLGLFFGDRGSHSSQVEPD